MPVEYHCGPTNAQFGNQVLIGLRKVVVTSSLNKLPVQTLILWGKRSHLLMEYEFAECLRTVN